MAVAAGVVGLPRQTAVVATFEVAAERRRAAGLDGAHDLMLHAPEMTPVGLAIRRAMAAEHIRHLQRRPHAATRINRAALPLGSGDRTGSLCR